jgi:lysophospholipase L1-like esterase
VSLAAPAFRVVQRLLLLGFAASLGLPAAALPQQKQTRKPVAVKPLPRAGLENAQVLASFFAGLRELEAVGSDRIVRVLQFGDSHTAADFWPGRVRQRLQAQFGNGGPGLILPARPWRGYAHAGVTQLEGRDWPGTSLREKTSDGLVGLAGAALFPPQDGTFRLRATFGEFRIQVLGDAVPAVHAEAVEDPIGLPAIQGPQLTAPASYLAEHTLGDLPALRVLGQSGLPANALQELAVTFPEGGRFLGVDLRSGHGGVLYDELGLNGAELLDLERWNPGLRQALLAELHPDLLVVAYGTNDLGRTDLAPGEYAARAQALLTALKQESGAAVLVVGPLDRIGRKRRLVAGLKAGAARTIASLRQASLAAGCAFWDARKAMGGEGALLTWRRAGLAQRDLVHLTAPGYQRLGDLLTEALLTAFDHLGREREPE